MVSAEPVVALDVVVASDDVTVLVEASVVVVSESVPV